MSLHATLQGQQTYMHNLSNKNTSVVSVGGTRNSKTHFVHFIIREECIREVNVQVNLYSDSGVSSNIGQIWTKYS